MGRILRAAALGLAALAAVADPARAAAPSCEPGAWLDPATGGRLEHAAVVAAAASRAVVLLGETHDNAEHHRWQLSTLAALLGRRQDLVLGFEAFPRRVQPILDRWIAGEMAPEAFFAEVGWDEVWGYDRDLYLPLLHFARLHRIPVVALNVERYLVSRVGRVAVPMAAGDVLLFDGKLPHGTPVHRPGGHRWAVQYHYRWPAAVAVNDEARLAAFGSEGRGVTC